MNSMISLLQRKNDEIEERIETNRLKIKELRKVQGQEDEIVKLLQENQELFWEGSENNDHIYNLRRKQRLEANRSETGESKGVQGQEYEIDEPTFISSDFEYNINPLTD